MLPPKVLVATKGSPVADERFLQREGVRLCVRRAVGARREAHVHVVA